MTIRYGCNVPGHPENHTHDCTPTPPIVARIDGDDQWHAFDPLGDEPRSWCGRIVNTIFPNVNWLNVKTVNRCDVCSTMMESAW